MTRWLKKSKWMLPFWYALALPAGTLLAVYTWLVYLTSKVRPVGAGAAFYNAAIYVNWHEHLPFLIAVIGQRRAWNLMSSAPYMAPIALWTKLMGFKLVRGASGESNSRLAVAQLKNILAEGGSIMLAVDGPAGPVHQAKRGCVELAQATGVPIIAVGYRSRRGFIAHWRWDKAQFAVPFDDITVHFSDPWTPPAEMSTDAALTVVERMLNDVCQVSAA